MGENRRPDRLLGRVIAGRYRLTRHLGSGGMGVVYLAVQEGLDRDVVIKVIRPDAAEDPNAVARFEREARMAASVVHPNIVTVHDFGCEDDGLFFLVMERLVGRSLRDVILPPRRAGSAPDEPAPERVALEWPFATECVRQIALALAAAHAKDVLHRDLKPSNVFLLAGVGHHHVAKVLDFGLAKRVRSPAEALTRSGEMIGTVGYASPEQLTEGVSDCRSDLFSLGVLWYELLTGKHPFQAETEASTIVNQVQLNPEPPSKLSPDIPPDVDTIVMRLLAKDPTRRTPSAEDLLLDLDSLVDSARVMQSTAPSEPRESTKRIPLRARTPPAKPKRWPTLLTAGVTALALVALVFVVASSSSQATTEALLVPSTDVARRGFSSLPARNLHDQRLVDLGRLLFHDQRLSGPNTISCATCHPMSNAGTTPEAQTMLGATGARAKWNTPTTWNASLSYMQAWRADAETISMIIDRPLFNPDLMGAKDWSQIEVEIRSDVRYGPLFERAGVPQDRRGVGDALTAYIEQTTPRGAAFDRFLDGDTNALDPLARAGFERFQALGCVACHQGAGLGGNMIAVFGVLAGGHPYEQRGQCSDGTFCRSDAGCGENEKCMPSTLIRPEDHGIPSGDPTRGPTYMFKVPSLRNVDRTGPWFHDGSARTLPEAVRTMGKLQLGLELSPDDVDALVAFLSSLAAPLSEDERRLGLEAAKWSAL